MPADDAPADQEPTPYLSQTLRRAGRTGTRILALVSLLAAGAAIVYVVLTASEPAPQPPLQRATAPAWAATAALSDALRGLRPGAPRGPARTLARRAARDVRSSARSVEALALPPSTTPVRGPVLDALRADTAWIDAVGSTLANPRSPRRAQLSRLARRAAMRTAVIATEFEDAADSVGGTSRLLAATAPA